MKKISRLLIPLFLTVSTLLGCSSNATNANNSAKDNKKIILTDGLGRKIELSKPAEKVLTNYTVPVHMIFTLGGQDTLIGADGGSLKNPLISSMKPGSQKLPDFKNKNTFNIEQAIALNPDLVLINAKSKKLIDDAEKHNLKVFAVNAESIDQLQSTMKNLGMALGKEDKADEFIKYYTQKIDFVKNKVKTVDQKNRPKVYIAGSDMFSTAGKDMFQNSMVELCGGTNVSSSLNGGWVKISLEQLLQWNPDVIVLTQYCGVKPEDVLNNPNLKNLNAVKNKKVYLFPSKISSWDMPCPQTILGILWLSKKINPEVFKDVNLQKEADDFYKQFYNSSFTKFGETID